MLLLEAIDYSSYPGFAGFPFFAVVFVFARAAMPRS